MLLDNPIWLKWAIHNEKGMICGVKENAPDDVKKAYNEHVQRKKEEIEEAIRIVKEREKTNNNKD